MPGSGFLSFVAILLYVGSIDASLLSAEDKARIKEAMRPSVIQCAEDFGVTEEQYEQVKKKGITSDIDPCFLSCILQKSGFFDSKGMFDVKKAGEFNKDNLKSEEIVHLFDTVTKDCVKVNDEEVSDGEKGCERAVLLFQCLLEHKKKLNIED